MSTRQTGRSRAGRGFWWTLAALVAALGAVAAFMGWYLSRGSVESLPALPGGAAADPAEWTGSRGVVIYHAAADGRGVVAEELVLPVRDRVEQEVADVLTALCAAVPPEGAVQAIPVGVEVRSVFLDRDSGHAVVDVSAALVTGHPGGVAAEQATLRSVLRTLAVNFPELRTCSLLVDGAQVTTLAGHVRADDPFVLGRWR